MKSFPFLRLPDDAVELRDTTIVTPSGQPFENGHGWETKGSYTVSGSLRVSRTALESRYPGSYERLNPRVAIEVYSPDTRYRIFQPFFLEANEETLFNISVLASEIGGTVKISTAIIVDLPSVDSTRKFDRVSTRIWDSEIDRLREETDHDGIHVLDVSFIDAGWAKVPWRIESSFANETDDFGRGITVYLNTDLKIPAEIETGRNKVARFYLSLEIMQTAVTQLSRIAAGIDADDLESLAQNYPRSLAAAVAAYGRKCAIPLARLVDLGQPPKSTDELLSVLKEIAGRHVF